MAPIPILIAVLLVLGLLNGLRRGVIREGTAMIGVLLGALLAQGWAATWARFLGAAVPTAKGHALGEKVLTLGLLFGIALLSGYGSGTLLPRRAEKMTVTQRVGGGVLGFVNMGLLLGFALLFVQRLWFDPFIATSPTPVIPDTGTSWIQRTPLTHFLTERLGLVLLGVAVAFAFASLIVGFVRLMSLLRRPAPAATPPKPAISLAPGTTGTPPPRPIVATTPVKPATSGPSTPTTTAVATPKPVANQNTTPTTVMAQPPVFRDDAGSPGR